MMSKWAKIIIEIIKDYRYSFSYKWNDDFDAGSDTTKDDTRF